MQDYLMPNEQFKVKCTDQELIQDLIELYTYWYKIANETHKEFVDKFDNDELEASDSYYIGQADGALEALSEIMLTVLGGGVTYDVWQKTMEWINR